MTGYEIAATILGALLGLLLVLYARTMRNDDARKSASSDLQKSPDRNQNLTVAKPDLISRTAGGIFKAHNFLSSIVGIAIIAAVLADAIFDRMTRLIVLSTFCVMLVVALFWLIRKKMK